MAPYHIPVYVDAYSTSGWATTANAFVFYPGVRRAFGDEVAFRPRVAAVVWRFVPRRSVVARGIVGWIRAGTRRPLRGAHAG